MHVHGFPENLKILSLNCKLIRTSFQLLETKPAVRVRRGSKSSPGGAQFGASTQNGGPALILHASADTLGCLCIQGHDKEQRYRNHCNSLARHGNDLVPMLTQINQYCKL